MMMIVCPLHVLELCEYVGGLGQYQGLHNDVIKTAAMRLQLGQSRSLKRPNYVFRTCLCS
jgi:hypothetical protein